MKKKGLAKRSLSLLLALTLVLGSTVSAFADDKPTPVTETQWENNEEMNNGEIKQNMDAAETAAGNAEQAANDAEAAADSALAASQEAATAVDAINDAVEAVFDTEPDSTTGEPIIEGELPAPSNPLDPSTAPKVDPADTDGKLNSLNNDIEVPIVGAEDIKAEADKEISDKEAEAADATEAALDKITENAKEAEDLKKVAEDKATEANDALEEAKAATTEAEAIAAVDKANTAAAEAQKAADDANLEVQEAKNTLAEAQKELDKLIAELDKLIDGIDEDLANGVAGVDGYADKLEAKKKEAQDAIDAAQAKVTAAEEEFNKVSAERATIDEKAKEAKEAAEKAAIEAGIAATASEKIDKALKNPTQEEIDALKEDVAAKKTELDNLKNQETEISKEQDEKIQELEEEIKEHEATIAAKEKEIADVASEIKKLDDQKAELDRQKKAAERKKAQLEDSGLFYHSKIHEAREVVSKGRGGYEDKWNWRKLRNEKVWVEYYTQEEIDAAKALIHKYDVELPTTISECEAKKTEIDNSKKSLVEKKNGLVNEKSVVEKAKADANDGINTAKKAKEDAAAAVLKARNECIAAQNEQSDLELYLASFTFTPGEGQQVTTLTKEQEEKFKKLLADMQQTSDEYNQIYNDTAQYEWATADRSFLEWLGGLFTGDTWKKLSDELNLEVKYHGWETKNGTYIVIQNDKDNTQSLILIRGDKATYLDADQKELATFSAAYDKVIAAQAKERAAEAAAEAATAAKKVADAQSVLEKAKDTLAKAQERLNGIDINSREFEIAKQNLLAAKAQVDIAEASYDKANEKAEEAKKDAEDAEKELDKFKPVPSTPGGDTPGDDTPGGDTTPTDGTPGGTTPAGTDPGAPIFLPLAGAAGAVGGAPGGAAGADTEEEVGDEEGEEIEEGEVPLAGDLDSTNEQTKDEESDNKNIDNNKVPLSPMDEQNGFNWWWVLLVAVVVLVGGTVAYNENKKRQANKKAEK